MPSIVKLLLANKIENLWYITILCIFELLCVCWLIYKSVITQSQYLKRKREMIDAIGFNRIKKIKCIYFVISSVHFDNSLEYWSHLGGLVCLCLFDSVNSNIALEPSPTLYKSLSLRHARKMWSKIRPATRTAGTKAHKNEWIWKILFGKN